MIFDIDRSSRRTRTIEEREERIEIIWNLEQWIYESIHTWGRILQNKWLYNWNRHFLTSLISSFITVSILLLYIITLLISTISILSQLEKKKERKEKGKKFRNILNKSLSIYLCGSKFSNLIRSIFRVE